MLCFALAFVIGAGLYCCAHTISLPLSFSFFICIQMHLHTFVQHPYHWEMRSRIWDKRNVCISESNERAQTNIFYSSFCLAYTFFFDNVALRVIITNAIPFDMRFLLDGVFFLRYFGVICGVSYLWTMYSNSAIFWRKIWYSLEVVFCSAVVIVVVFVLFLLLRLPLKIGVGANDDTTSWLLMLSRGVCFFHT